MSPAGGNWIVQNKQRPGAYINFVSAPNAIGAMGDRGVMTMALPMTWGPSGTLIELLGTDLLDGKSLAKVGVTAFDGAASLPYRLALSGCLKALIFRADAGGVNAFAVLAGTATSEILATAKYPGTTGNAVTIKAVADTPSTGLTTLSVWVNGVIKESFVIDETTPAVMEDIVSDWITITVGAAATAVPELAGTPLESGTNGTVTETIYADYFALVSTVNWQVMAIDSSTETAPAMIIEKIRQMRDELGRKVQAVVYNDVSADYEGIISVKQGFKTAVDIVPVNLFPIWVASQTAGAPVNKSLTGTVVPNAIELTAPIAESDIAAALAAGWFVLSFRQDGAICVEQDINCLHTLTVDRGYAFTKNRVVRCLDEIGNSVALIFNKNYLGKVDNNNIGRNLFKSEVITFIEQLQGIGAVTDFAGSSEVIVLPGEAIDAVVVDLTIKPVDSMEKIYMTVNIDA